MASIQCVLALVTFGLFHLVTCQTVPGLSSLVSQNMVAGLNVKADVIATVMTLLNETGYHGKATDANVQEIVAMLMNGTVPTDADLVRLGIIPSRLSSLTTAQPSISGSQTGFDESSKLRTFGLPSGFQTSPTGGSQFGASAGGLIGGSAGVPIDNLLVGGTVLTTPRPVLGDPFSFNSVAGSGVPLPTLGSTIPNELGPKPFSNVDPIGGLGTSSTDILGSLGTNGPGFGSSPQPLQTDIVDTTMHQQNQQRGMTSNPMMMMFMMNPELMEGMMADSPMMSYMMMQQMARPRRRPQITGPTAAASYPMREAGGLSGSAAAGGMGEVSGGLMDLTKTLGPVIGSLGSAAGGMGGGSGGLMDLTKSLGPVIGSLGSAAGGMGGGSGGLMDLAKSLGPVIGSLGSAAGGMGGGSGGLMDLTKSLGPVIGSLGSAAGGMGGGSGGLMDLTKSLGPVIGSLGSAAGGMGGGSGGLMDLAKSLGPVIGSLGSGSGAVTDPFLPMTG